tara:strand:- start:182 stop:295 length:114 start_codon:yes stop_codon:yes gene_type:complete
MSKGLLNDGGDAVKVLVVKCCDRKTKSGGKEGVEKEK